MASQAVEEFLAKSGAGESSLRTYRMLLEQAEKWTGRPLAEASKRDLTELKAKLRTKRSGANYARRARAFYFAMAKAARGTPDGARYEEMAELMTLKQRVKRLSPDEILTLPEVNRMLEAADSMRDRALVATLWATGQRISAVAGLRLADLKDVPSDNGGAAIRVFFREVKVSGEEHSGYILDREGGDHLRKWLEAYPYARTEDAPVFPSYNPMGADGVRMGKGVVTGAPLTRSGAAKVVRSTARRAGITKRMYPHLFRHSRATHLLRIGVPAVQVKKLLGWAAGSSVLERTYQHLADQDAYRALLTANGMEPDKAPDLGKLAAADSLKPVIAIVPTPDTKGKGVGRTGLPSRKMLSLEEQAASLIEELARTNPKVAEFLRLTQSMPGKNE